MDLVERLTIPELTKLAAIGVDDARSKGLLPSFFDERARILKEWRTKIAGPSWKERIRVKIERMRKRRQERDYAD